MRGCIRINDMLMRVDESRYGYICGMGGEKLCNPYPVPQYLQNHVPRTLETRYPILSKPCTTYPQARNYVPLDTMHLHRKFDKQVELRQ